MSALIFRRTFLYVNPAKTDEFIVMKLFQSTGDTMWLPYENLFVMKNMHYLYQIFTIVIVYFWQMHFINISWRQIIFDNVVGESNE